MAGQDIQSVKELPASGSGGAGGRGGGVVRAASAMGLATFFSRIAGLIREQVLAYFFGAGNATDAFNIAFRIPNLLRDLFAEGAMSAALVPTYTRVREEEGQRRAWRVAGLVFRSLAVIAGAIALVGILFAPELVDIYASSYREVPGKFEMTVNMTRVMFPFFPLVALAAAYMGILNATGKFFLPAFASALFNLTNIVVGVALALLFPRFGLEPILGMAIGVLAGGVVQAFCQLPSLYRAGYRFESPVPGDPPWYRDPALRRMIALMLPGLVGLAATQVNVLVNSILATSQGSGAVSWLNYSFRLMQFPIGIFGVSMAAAVLPVISRSWVLKDYSGTAQTLDQNLRRVMAVNLPASAGLAFLGVPIIQLLFEYGHFAAEDTRATAMALAAYSTGLAAYSMAKVLVPACYALGITRLAVVSSVLSVGVTVGLNLLMIDRFGYVGLALGTSIGAFANAGTLFFGIARRIRMQSPSGSEAVGLSALSLLRSFAGYGLLALLMGSVCHITYDALSGYFPAVESFEVLRRVLLLGVTIVEGLLVVLCAGRIFGLSELNEAFDFFTGKLKKKLSRLKS